MRKTNQIWSSFMALLLTSTILVSASIAAPPQPPPPPTIPNVYVDPAAKVDPSVDPDETFTVDIKVTEVKDVYGWGFFLYYRSSLLNVTSVDLGDFADWSWEFRTRIFNTLGYCTAAAYFDPENPVEIDGSGTLVTVTFLVKAVGTTTLDLVNTKINTIIGGTSVPIEHTASDGLFDNRPANAPPIARFAAPSTGAEGDTITLDATTSSDDGWIVGYQWDFGDGSTGSGDVVLHTYPDVGEYIVTLTATDNNGATGSAQRTLEILPWMVGGYFPDLVGGVAWPEASVNPNEDKSFNEKQLGDDLTLWAKVGNPVDKAFLVRVDFDIYSVDGTYLGKVSSEVETMAPYETRNIHAHFLLADSRWRNYPYWRQKYHATAYAFHNTTGSELERGRFPAALWFRINAEDHDRSIVSMTATSPVTSGDVATITVTIENQGWADETGTVSFAIDLNTIESQQVTIPVRGQTTVVFYWDTDGYKPDSYFLQVKMTPHPFERDTIDNVVQGTIVVTV